MQGGSCSPSADRGTAVSGLLGSLLRMCRVAVAWPAVIGVNRTGTATRAAAGRGEA